MTTETDMRYQFGANWADFLEKNLSAERVEIAKQKMLSFLGVDSLRGVRMVDVGSGSGIHSLAALRSSASEIVSFDYDPESVATTRMAHRYAGSPASWKIEQGSILDAGYVDSLGKFDLVYSWGVLHHTGDQWAALNNAVALVEPDGVLFIALYAAEVARPSPEFWLRVKRSYNAGGHVTKRLIEAWYVLRHMAGLVLRSRTNPVTYLRNYKQSRGMSYMTNVRDWVGGWPMEFSTTAEVTEFLRSRGFDRVNLLEGEACTEYLFKRRA